MLMLTYNPARPARPEPWNKGKLVGPKPPFKLQEIWSIRIRLQIEHRTRELAIFNLAIESKLRGCDLVRLRVSDVMHGHHAVDRAMVIQHKTRQPVRFELTEHTRDAVEAWVKHAGLTAESYLFPSRVATPVHSPICQARQRLGCVDRAKSEGIWDAFAAAHKSNLGLSSDEEPSSGPALAWPQQAGEHRAILGHRS